MTDKEKATAAINLIVHELREETGDSKLLEDKTNHLISLLIERYISLLMKSTIPQLIVKDTFKLYMLGLWRTMELYPSSCKRYYLYIETIKLWDLAVLQYDRSSSTWISQS